MARMIVTPDAIDAMISLVDQLSDFWRAWRDRG
jgi:hypothetical protein